MFARSKFEKSKKLLVSVGLLLISISPSLSNSGANFIQTRPESIARLMIQQNLVERGFFYCLADIEVSGTSAGDNCRDAWVKVNEASRSVSFGQIDQGDTATLRKVLAIMRILLQASPK